MIKPIQKIIATICSGIIIGFVVFAGQSKTATTDIECDYPNYNSLNEMINTSNLIVDGLVVNDNGISIMDTGAGELKYRIFDFKVSKCIKGNVEQGDTIPIKILDITDNTDNMLENNSEYICFLKTYDDGIPASLINIDQASLLVTGNDLILSEEEKFIVNNSIGNSIISKVQQTDDIGNIKDQQISKDDLIDKIEYFIN